MGEYHDLYINTDTLLLADVFENFRNKCLKTYELDPLHFVSAPGLAWQACLKKTGVKLELLTDIDMLLMVEEGIRGGICQVSQRYSKANNKYMKDFDKNKESTYIQYFDANNLYGWAMSQPLPVGYIKWIKNKSKFTTDFIKNYDVNSDKGYIFEATIIYPEKLHDKHKDLPFLPDKQIINKCQKLICSIYDKEKYVVHIRALKQALNYGLELEKVHNVIEFKQEAWMKSYIDMNTELRKNTNNESDKNFFKLMNNSVFGKTMESVRNYRDIKLVRANKRRNQQFQNPTIILQNIFQKI